jgi:hypothetical protein
MHSAALADPLNPFSKGIKAIKQNRRRTEVDEEVAAQLEWQGSLYFDPQIGPFVPGVNLEAMLKESAKRWRKGKDIERGVFVPEEKVQLGYDGPRDLDKLKLDPRFRDVRPARMPSTGARVIRVRPKFPEPWTLAFTVSFEETLIEAATLREIMERAGREIGLGDWRPRYGIFEVTS